MNIEFFTYPWYLYNDSQLQRAVSVSHLFQSNTKKYSQSDIRTPAGNFLDSVKNII